LRITISKQSENKAILIYENLCSLLNDNHLAYYKNAIQKEINKKEASPLINQIMEHRTTRSYDLLMKTWQEISYVFG